MTTLLIGQEFAAIRVRFGRALAVSVTAHALLFVGLLLAHRTAPPPPPSIVEVSWLDQVQPVAPPVAAAEPVRQAPPPAPVTEPVRETPARASLPAKASTVKAAPAADAGEARRAEQRRRLAATPNEVAEALNVPPPSAPQLPAVAPTGGSDLTRAAAATMMPVAETGRPVALVRGPEVKASALAMNRGPAVVGGGAVPLADLPGGSGTGNGTGDVAGTAAAAAAGREEASGNSVLDDVQLRGPAADRPVVASTMPDYPDWARRQAIEARVTLHFTVLPDGRVREDVQVQKTGGFREFDERAVTALRAWRFAPLAAGGGEQWGTITFRFRLRG